MWSKVGPRFWIAVIVSPWSLILWEVGEFYVIWLMWLQLRLQKPQNPWCCGCSYGLCLKAWVGQGMPELGFGKGVFTNESRLGLVSINRLMVLIDASLSWNPNCVLITWSHWIWINIWSGKQLALHMRVSLRHCLIRSRFIDLGKRIVTCFVFLWIY